MKSYRFNDELYAKILLNEEEVFISRTVSFTCLSPHNLTSFLNELPYEAKSPSKLNMQCPEIPSR